VIIAVDGMPIAGVDQLARLVGEPEIGNSFTITVVRGSQHFKLQEVASPSAYLGVEVKDDKAGGPKVVTAPADSPAAKAGLRPADVITAVDKTPVTSVKTLLQAISMHAPGDSVQISYTRGSRKLETNAKLTTRPAN
jgi:S1-C subfamily serine protease